MAININTRHIELEIYTLYEIHFQISIINHPSYFPVRGFCFILISVVYPKLIIYGANEKVL